MTTDITLPISAIPPDVLADLQEAVAHAAKGTRDLAAAKRACERMDQMREELRQRIGDLNVAVDLIREGRDEA